MNAWKAALAAAFSTAAIALIVIAPMAQSSKGRVHPGLKVVTSHSFGTGSTVTKCPKGFIPIAGGFTSADGSATRSDRVSRRGWEAAIDDPNGSLVGTATCVKGTGGFRLGDVNPPVLPTG